MAQLVSAPACHAGGCGFESRLRRFYFSWLPQVDFAPNLSTRSVSSRYVPCRSAPCGDARLSSPVGTSHVAVELPSRAIELEFYAADAERFAGRYARHFSEKDVFRGARCLARTIEFRREHAGGREVHWFLGQLPVGPSQSAEGQGAVYGHAAMADRYDGGDDCVGTAERIRNVAW